MSRTVKIPECANPFEVIVNSVKHCYPAGETVEVPDEVADIIESHNKKHEPVEHKHEPPFSGGGTASGGGGADLLDENGIIKQEYLPEGFPYKSGEDVEIMPGTMLTADPESGVFIIPNTINTSGLSVDSKCVVRFEVAGEASKYEVTAKEAPENGDGLKWVLGNMGLLDDEAENTGEPFLIVLYAQEVAAETGAGGMMAYGFPAESLTVSISGFKGTFATIDPGYLPTVETVIVKVAGDIQNDDYTTSHTTKEVDSLLRLGKVVMVEYRKTADELARHYYQLGDWLPDISASFYPIGPVLATLPSTIRANIASSDNNGNNWQAYYD